MTIKEYQIECKRTCPGLGSREKDLLHMKLGIITELGEVLDIFKKNLAYGKPIDYINLGEELADICWYLFNKANFLKFKISFDTYYMDFKINSENEVLDYLSDPDFDSDLGLADFTLKKIAEFYNLDFEKLLDINIAKLKVRFPDKFTEEQALNRDLDSERQVLENGYNVDVP
jgi:NTP pyrophosphatase (non-canonical NTP hydrolase)